MTNLKRQKHLIYLKSTNFSFICVRLIFFDYMDVRRGKDFLQRLILGDVVSNISPDYNRAVLTGYLCLTFLSVNLFHTIKDLFLKINGYFGIYLLTSSLSILAFILNRKKKYNPAKTILLVTALLSIIYYSTFENLIDGYYFYFFPLIFAAFALFDYKNLFISFLFLFSTLILFFIAFNYKFPLFDNQIITGTTNTYSHFLLQFTLGIMICVIIITFLSRTNHINEKNLIHKEAHLNKTTKELKASKIQFELAIRGSNAGIYDWNIKDDTVYHSPIWKNMLGYEDDELENFTISDFFELIHPDDQRRIVITLQNHLHNGSPYSEELRLMTKSGDYKWFIDSGQAVWNEEGEPIRMVGSIVNINERKIAEEFVKKQNRMLEKANLELDQFVYSASHDLRSPLTSILGLINIARQSKDQEEINHCLNLMNERVNKLDEIILDIIDFSKNSKLGLSCDKIDLHKLFNEILESYQHIIKYENIQITLLIEPGFYIYSDVYRIKIILKNILINALRFYNKASGNPWIIIEAFEDKRSVKIAIEDNGEGIKKEEQKKIFNMFYRGSERSKGSGLGLYIAKEFVEKLNGNISVQSIYNQGSRFIVELPVNNLQQKQSDDTKEEIINPASLDDLK